MKLQWQVKVDDGEQISYVFSHRKATRLNRFSLPTVCLMRARAL